MSLNIAITGLAQSGKTTIFNALTHGHAESKSHAPEGLALHLGMAKVPEPRLQSLAGILHPNKIVPAEIKYVDIGASVKTLAEAKGMSSQLLNQVSTADALFHVVRAFKNDSVPHPDGSLDIHRDVANMELELTFSDLAIIERRLQKIEESMKAVKTSERQAYVHEQSLLAKLKMELEKDIPIRELKLAPEEMKAVSSYQFLSAKPLLTVVNIGEEQLAEAQAMETELNNRYARPNRHVITLCGKLEMELAQMDEAAARDFRKEFGINESGLDRSIKVSYELLGLITFFSIASGEVRAWSIPGGTAAPHAAGKIHSDMERGFIRAEVISYSDLLKSGSIAEAKRKGLLRLEGKNYIAQDGDVITFLFNV